MACDCQLEFVFRYAFAVVLNANSLNTPTIDANGDLRRTSVLGILQQFFDNRRRTINHFACGNLADQYVGQQGNRAVAHPLIISGSAPGLG